jgi:hypothetical protein
MILQILCRLKMDKTQLFKGQSTGAWWILLVFCIGMGNPWVFCGFFHEYGYENLYPWKSHTHSQVTGFSCFGINVVKLM